MRRSGTTSQARCRRPRSSNRAAARTARGKIRRRTVSRWKETENTRRLRSDPAPRPPASVRAAARRRSLSGCGRHHRKYRRKNRRCGISAWWSRRWCASRSRRLVHPRDRSRPRCAACGRSWRRSKARRHRPSCARASIAQPRAANTARWSRAAWSARSAPRAGCPCDPRRPSTSVQVWRPDRASASPSDRRRGRSAAAPRRLLP